MNINKESLGTESVVYCEGCEADVKVTLERVDHYHAYAYFWACEEFAYDGDEQDGRMVDLTNWEHATYL